MGGNTERTCPNPKTWKCDGGPPSGPDSQRTRTGEATEGDEEDKAITERHTAGLPDADVVVTTTRGQLNRAGKEPKGGWPAYEFMYPMGDPLDVARSPIFVTKKI